MKHIFSISVMAMFAAGAANATISTTNYVDTGLALKLGTDQVETAVTQDSAKVVTSGAVKTYVDGQVSTINTAMGLKADKTDASKDAKGLVQVGDNIAVAAGTISVANGTTDAKGVVQLDSTKLTGASTDTIKAATLTTVSSVVGKIPTARGGGTWVDIWVE